MIEGYKPILCLDFDGVIHSYTSGWMEADFIPDPPVPGAIQFLLEAVKHFEVHIFSSRSHQHGGIRAMQNWLRYWAQCWAKEESNHMDALGQANSMIRAVKWPTEKPPALVTIDDRAICFTGEWPDIETIKQFKPWNKR